MKKMPLMITCAEFEEFVIGYFEGDLPRRRRLLFEMHLKMCRSCRSYLQAYRRSIELGKSVFRYPDAPVPDDVPEDLVRAILDVQSSGRR